MKIEKKYRKINEIEKNRDKSGSPAYVFPAQGRIMQL